MSYGLSLLAACLEENLRSRTCDAFDGQVTDKIVGWKFSSLENKQVNKKT